MTFHGVRSFAMSRSGRRLAILQNYGSTKVLDIPSGERSLTLWGRGTGRSLILLPEGRYVAVSSEDVVELHEVATTTLVGFFSS